MSSAPELVGDDRLAAEFVLRLLDPDESSEALRRLDTDPAFGDLVAFWEERLASFVEEVPAQAPPPDLWLRISTKLEPANDNEAGLEKLRRRANAWRAYAGVVTALAAALLLVVGLDLFRSDPVLQPPVATEGSALTMVASLSAEKGPAALIITYDPRSRSLIATPAVLQGADGHDHELWLVPASGQPRSLGIVTAGRSRKISVRPEIVGAMGPDATLAISVEPEGGSPTGQPTGPVIASGQLSRV